MVIQCFDRPTHELVTGSKPTNFADMQICQQYTLSPHSKIKSDLKELLETCVLYFFSLGCYDWFVIIRNGAPSKEII
jgi:hypothetical protein